MNKARQIYSKCYLILHLPIARIRIRNLEYTLNSKRFSAKAFFSSSHFARNNSSSERGRDEFLLNRSLCEISSMLKEGSTTSKELVSCCLKWQKLWNPVFNAFITPSFNRSSILPEKNLGKQSKLDFSDERHEQSILFQAEESDRRRKSSACCSPLEGIPIAVKDNFCTRQIRTTAASKMLSTFVPAYDSTVCRKLTEQGAIIIGKTNMDEFSMGSTSTNSYFGQVVNPWSPPQKTRDQFDGEKQNETLDKCILSAGGSSGGSAAAVASRMCFGAIGSDTGGSVRQPAAFCGVVGFKPTYGRVSRYGLIAYSSSLDTPGVLTKTVQDAATLIGILYGQDTHDSTSIPSEAKFDWGNQCDLRGIRVGIVAEYHVKELSPQVLQVWESTAKRMEELGAQLIEVSLKQTCHALPAYYIIASAEAYSNLARYDGIRFGHRAISQTKSGDDLTLEDLYCKSRSEGFGEEVQRRILLGSFVLSRRFLKISYLHGLIPEC